MSNYTKDQLRIIDEKDKNMIVSASAGSGKTTVMIERIVKLMVDGEVPISKFLIVTFTKASSSDMKNKLIKKLGEKEPTPFILQQIDDIPISDISNLHSFCARLLKNYFFEVGLDPAFVVLDENESNKIKERAMDILFREQYEQNSEFYDLVDVFSKNRKDYKLRELILKLNSFLATESDSVSWFRNGLKNYDVDYSKNPSAVLLNDYIIKSIQSLKIECEKIIEELNVFNQTKMIEFLQKMQTNLSKVHFSFDYVRNSKAILSFEKLGNIPKVDLDFEDLKNKVKIFRDKYKAVCDKLKDISVKDEKQMQEWLSKTQKRVESLYSVTCRFKEIYSNLKKEKGGLDFNDLEEYSCKVLENKNILDELKGKYEYVFVDEYQDINGMQEKIISLVSRINNRFMVGDVKQSIYRFRLCDPQIFIDKYQTYTLDKKTSAVFDLNDNFRSHRDILDLCNFVFSRTMTNDFGGLEYKNKKMKSGLDDWENKGDNKNINLVYIDTHKEKVDEEKCISGVYSVENHKNETSEDEKSSVAEALIVAKNISELMLHSKIYDAASKKYRKIDYKDIVILTASRSEQLREFISTLRDFDIPVSADLVADANDDPFVCGVKNLFKIISNAVGDQDMFNCLYSPLFDFSPSDLAKIRECDTESEFNQNILFGVIKDTLLQRKIQSFREKLTKYKKYAAYRTVPELLAIVESDLDLLVKIYAAPTSEESLVKYAKFKNSLPNILLVDYLQEADAIIPIESSVQSNSIKIMTIHKSKGLEFPVVFIIGMGRNFNLKSIYGDCLYSKELGVGMSYFDEQARFKSETIAIQAARIIEKEKLLEEQQRLLYVAMTRAINYLYLIGSRDSAKLHSEFENPNCFLDWFSEALFDTAPEKLNIETFDLVDLYENRPKVTQEEIIYSQCDKDLVKRIVSKFDESYLYENSTNLPVKSSFTALARENQIKYKQTSHIENEDAIKIGNAYHKVLQYISFESNSVELINKEIQRMIESGKILEEEKNLVDIKILEKVLNLPVIKNLTKEDCVLMREKEFYYNMETQVENDSILVQGIIDLLVIKKNSFDIIDYKTSRLSNNYLINKYKEQLSMYSKAVQLATGKTLGQATIISLLNGEAVKIF